MKKKFIIAVLLLNAAYLQAFAQIQPRSNDVTTPLHALQPDYPMPYRIPVKDSIKNLLDRIFNYLDLTTPPHLVDASGNIINDIKQVDSNTRIRPGDFRLTSYEWGVTYSGMLLAGKATRDQRYTDYVKKRMDFIVNALPSFEDLYKKNPKNNNPFRQPIAPAALDDAGAICAAMIRMQRDGNVVDLRPQINKFISYITTKEYRLSDGTLARNRPQKNTLWLDDLYMSVPALAQMGKLTGEKKYFDEAAKQILLFSKRMFNPQLGIYMHGWVEGMEVHPEFHWARANGWALMAMIDLLEVLPQDHKNRKEILAQLQAHIKGLASFQSGKGFWHQLLDRNDSYLETSATAIYTYCIAKAINMGWIDKTVYAPMCLLSWQAVSTKVNVAGQVEGTCVGTGMAFDPAFYYYRPINVYAAHGYGPVLLAGAEMLLLLEQNNFEINDSSIQLKSAK